jgi:uncharacterized DUF497 family protein
MSVRFEWDREKAKSNLQRHRVSFDEAGTVFADPLARIFFDDDHSVAETREIIIGHSNSQRLLLVSFTERRPNGLRIISARVATRKERKSYEENQDA